MTTPTKEQIEAAAAVMNDHGINICLPWEGDLDDLERERFEALKDAISAAMDLNGWKEATIAWRVCASLHRQYCKGRDPFFKTRQADFTKHENDAREHFNQQERECDPGVAPCDDAEFGTKP